MSLAIIGFNSTLVQLKIDSANSLTSFPVMFQFHIGSIKKTELLAKLIVISEFQFHIGSIKNNQSRRIINRLVGFQFHIGSIKNYY